MWKCKRCNSEKKSGHKDICHRCYLKEWKQKNKDKVQISDRRYDKKHPERRKRAFDNWKKKHPKYWNNYLKKYNKDRGIIYQVIKSTNNRFSKYGECSLCG